MKNRIFTLSLTLLLLLSLFGCGNMLDTEYRSVTPHPVRSEQSSQENQPDTEVSIPAGGSLQELTRAVENLVKAKSEYGVIRAASYEGDIDQDAEDACLGVTYNTAYGTYAVHNVSYTVNKYVSFSEVRVHLSYREDILDYSSIPHIYTKESGRIILENTLRSYGTRLVIITSIPDLTTDSLASAVEELYYTGADWMPVIPQVNGNTFPPEGEERILDLSFRYEHSNYRMDSMTARTQAEVDALKERLEGLDTKEALRQLSEHLRDNCRVVIESGTEEGYDRLKDQYTAYGALALGRASGEGFAMAVKKVCSSLEIPCLVVRGRLNNAAHAWNLVEVDGSWYHLDTSRMEDVGFDPCFLAEDAAFLENYYWDTEKYPASASVPLEEPIPYFPAAPAEESTPAESEDTDPENDPTEPAVPEDPPVNDPETSEGTEEPPADPSEPGGNTGENPGADTPPPDAEASPSTPEAPGGEGAEDPVSTPAESGDAGDEEQKNNP